MVLPATRNDYRAIETYEYDPDRRLTVPLIALTGDNDPRRPSTRPAPGATTPRAPSTCASTPVAISSLTPHAADVIDVINRFLTSQRKVRDDSLVGQ